MKNEKATDQSTNSDPFDFIFFSNPTVDSIQNDFLSRFGIHLRIYKGRPGRGARIADQNTHLGNLVSDTWGEAKITIDPDETVGEFEQKVYDSFGLGIQVCAPEDPGRLFDNEKTLGEASSKNLKRIRKSKEGDSSNAGCGCSIILLLLLIFGWAYYEGQLDEKLESRFNDIESSQESSVKETQTAPESESEAEHESGVAHAQRQVAEGQTKNKSMPGERFPETRLRRIDSNYARQLEDADLQYAINEMFARHGAVFGRKDIAEAFNSKEWYDPDGNLSFDDVENSRFNDIERANLKVLGAERDGRGVR